MGVIKWGLEKIFYGRSNSANQCEGGYKEGKEFIKYRCSPFGKDRFPVGMGKMRMFGVMKIIVSSHEAIDMYNRYKEDIALFAEMGFIG